MTAPYTPSAAAHHATITVPDDGDEPSGALFSVPYEQLADNIEYYRARRVVLQDGESFTIPAGVLGIRFQMIAKGGNGGAGGTTGGGGGGGAGQYVDVFLPAAALPAVGASLTFDSTAGFPGTVVCAVGSAGAAAATVTGGVGGDSGILTPQVGTVGVGGAAGTVGGSPSCRRTGGGGGGGSAGASGGTGGYAWNVNDGGNNLEVGSFGLGSTTNATQGSGGGGYGAGGGGGGGSSTGRGGGGAAGWAVADAPAVTAGGGTVTTTGGTGAAGIAVLTVFKT